jgi:hypothetical protein
VKTPKVRTRIVDCWLVCGIFAWKGTPMTATVSRIVRIPRLKTFLADNNELRQFEGLVAAQIAQEFPKPQRKVAPGIVGVGGQDIIPVFVITSASMMGQETVEVIEQKETADVLPFQQIVEEGAVETEVDEPANDEPIDDEPPTAPTEG